MSTVVARRVASTPVRTASQTWAKIVEMLAPNPASAAHAELRKAAVVACASISSEATRDDAIIVWGAGPRVRIYCIFDEDAITGDDINEDPLLKLPTDGDWNMSIPCLPEDLPWSNAQLGSVSTRISARAAGEELEDDEKGSKASAPPLTINPAEFFKP